MTFAEKCLKTWEWDGKVKENANVVKGLLNDQKAN